MVRGVNEYVFILRVVASAGIGRISFAGQDTEGAPSIECAIASGQRAATEVLAFL